MDNLLELVIEQDNRPVTTSRKVAEAFEKEHKNVIRDIEGLDCSENFRRLNFELSSYKSLQNKEMPEYIMSRDGFTFLAMGYTGKKAAQFKEAYIDAFNKMELALRSKQAKTDSKQETINQLYKFASLSGVDKAYKNACVAEALRLLANTSTNTDKTKIEKGELKFIDKVRYDKLANPQRPYTTEGIAKVYGICEDELNAILKALGIQACDIGVWFLTVPYQHQGYRVQGRTWLWTPAGAELIYKALKTLSISPLDESSKHSNPPAE